MRNGRFVYRIKCIFLTHCAFGFTVDERFYIVFVCYIAPEWATECLIRALPSLTIQYMADSATIELSRDCGAAEGMKRLTCNGKQDQDMIQRELMCMSERETITSDNEMKATNDEIPLDDEDVMLQSDNTENNNIDKVANQIESTVDKVGDKYNLDEVMMGDAPLESQEDKLDKPVKSTKKIASEKPLKNQPKQMRKLKAEQKEELMMGDQPAVSVPADEILPHVKKVINAEITKSEEIVTTPKTVVEFKQTTVEVRSRRETEVPVKSNHSATTESNIKINSEQIHSKATHKGILSFDHFIPPMLLVQHQNATAAPPSGEEADKTTTLVVNTTAEPMDEANQTSSTQVPTTISDDFTTNGSSVETSSTTLTTIAAVSNTTQETTTTPATTPAHIHHPNEYTKTNMMRPHAPKFGGEISYHAPNFTNLAKETIDLATVNESTTVTEVGNSTESMAVAANTTVAVVDAGSTTTTTVTSSEPSEQQTTEMTQTMNVSTTVTSVPHLEVAKRSNSVSNVDKYQHKQEHEQKPISHQHFDDANTKHADFTNSNLDYQYKPNRKRILTKPETHTYIQKIFG